MAEESRCSKCGAHQSESTPYSLCPKCLMQIGLEGEGEQEGVRHRLPAAESPGTRIGHYELLDLIGEGGMGLVYLAEQKEPIQRRVALKIVKLGMDTLQVVARFRAEQQTLAMLAHPNIAQVFDAGMTESGRPYFVMEYVQGTSITKYCDEHKLSVTERLELFKQVCEGVHYAHQKGIIHRDLKPSNVLVSTQGNRHVPKIIDFGVAKALTEPLADTTCFTREGQLLGTPEYMSPEQVDLATQDIDIRSDIYSLGVLLYELLAGVLPFDRESFTNGGFAGVQRTIQEEEPTPPSTRLTSLGEKAKVIAERRRTQLLTLARCLHKELEWIPMKAIRKDRTRRYRSASELADDIQNYLNGAPLIAGPESSAYRARKFVRKHAGSVTTVALVAVAILIGLAASIVMGCRAERAREKEVIARTQAEEVRDQEAALRAQVEQALVRAENAEGLAENYRRTLYFNRIALADVAYRNNDVRRLRELLTQCPEDLRGWEWHYLSNISDQSYKTLYGHTGYRVGVSPDGKLIASGSQDKTIKVWDASTGTELTTLRGHDAKVAVVAFHPDGNRIVSGAYDGTIEVWDVTSGKELMTVKGHKRTAGALFGPNGKIIVSGSRDKTINIWDAETGTQLRTIEAHAVSGLDHAISPDGNRIVSCGTEKVVKVWDIATGDQVMVLRGHQDAVSAVGFSPDGKRIVSGSYDRTIRIWDALTGDELITIPGHKARVSAVTFSPDGTKIASCSMDGTVKLWDGSTGAELMTLRGHEAVVNSVSFDPTGKVVVSGGSDGTIKLWDVGVSRDRTHIGINGGAWKVNFSPDNRQIVSGNRDGTIKIWDRSTASELTTLQGSEGDAIVTAQFSLDGKRILASQVGSTVIWDVATGGKLMSLDDHTGYMLASFSPDGRQIVSVSVDSEWDYVDDTIELRSAATGEELKTFHGKGLTSAAFGLDGTRIVSGSIDGTITVWDTATGVKLVTFDAREGDAVVSMDVGFTSDGRHIVAHGSRFIKLWDAGTGKEVMTLPEQVKGIWGLAMSPNGERILVVDRGGMVKLWDVKTATEVMILREQGMEGALDLPALAFSPDGSTIAIGGSTGITFLESGPRPPSDHPHPSSRASMPTE